MTIRWQDWTNVLLGCWLVVSPLELEYSLNGDATANACGVGGVLLIFNLISACRLIDQGQEIFNILLGAWLIFSPYSLGFTAERVPAINAVALGIMIVGLAAWQMIESIRNGKDTK
jgi:hypothetical protein